MSGVWSNNCQTTLLGSLLVYRVIYYLIPLLVGVGLLAAYELYQRRQHQPPRDSARST